MESVGVPGVCKDSMNFASKIASILYQMPGQVLAPTMHTEQADERSGGCDLGFGNRTNDKVVKKLMGEEGVI